MGTALTQETPVPRSNPAGVGFHGSDIQTPNLDQLGEAIPDTLLAEDVLTSPLLPGFRCQVGQFF